MTFEIHSDITNRSMTVAARAMRKVLRRKRSILWAIFGWSVFLFNALLLIIAIDDLRKAVIETVIEPNLPSRLLDENTKYYVNPTGRFVIGGPAGDSGLTGRKIIVDTYGGYAAHGGGAFSGKDPTKVDRSGAYMARYIAKNLVAAGLADACQLQLAYAIGVAHPVSVLVETYGTGKIADDKLAQLVRECFDLRPAAIIKTLDLRRPIYRQTAGYGHFGRAELDLPWEKTDMVQTLLAKA